MNTIITRNKRQALNCFWHLLRTDLQILRATLFDKTIDLAIWVIAEVIVMTYLLPSFGLSENYGPFYAVGIMATAGLFEVFPSVMNLVGDIEGDRIISFYLMLPMPSWMVLLRAWLYYALNAALLGIIVLPMALLLLWGKFTLTGIQIIPFIMHYALVCLFYGAFTLLITSFLESVARVGSVWMRFLYPLWMFGSCLYAWHMLHTFWPALGTLMLLNPFTYVMEGMRSAVLEQSPTLPVWKCIGMLSMGTLLTGWWAIVRLKKRLDFV